MAATKTPRNCQVCGREKPADLRPGVLVRPAVSQLIKQDLGAWNEDGWICTDDLNDYRHRYVQSLLEDDKGELTSLENEVIASLHEQEILSRNLEEELQAGLSFGQRLADRIAAVGGSWAFIICFGVFLVVWITTSTRWCCSRARSTPIPFILLNLVLSCLAAIQAPVIMMSQNRQEAKDRLRSQHDYQVNLKAELEIRHLHEKIDHLLSHQWERLRGDPGDPARADRRAEEKGVRCHRTTSR